MIFSAEQNDVLTELINIGFARTASSLSDLTGHRVLLEAPEVAIHPIGDLASSVHEAIPGLIASVQQKFTGPVGGHAMLLLSCEGAGTLIRLLTNEHGSNDGRLDESSREVLAEVGNILLNACLGMFGNLLKVPISFSVPRVDLDGFDSMFRWMLIGHTELQCALRISTKFRLRDSAVQGCMVIILNVASMGHLGQALERFHEIGVVAA